MKRKDFLTRMRNRRRGDQLELREPGQRRATDWRTLRVELPTDGESSAVQQIAVGRVELVSSGVRLAPTEPCWVRGYRLWRDDDGQPRAEFQYRQVVDEGAKPPPGATAVHPGDTWEPAAD